MNILFFIRSFFASIFYNFLAMPPLIQLTIGILVVLLIFSFCSKKAKVLFWLLYPFFAGIFMSLCLFSSLNVINEESDFMYSIVLGGVMGFIFGLKLAIHAFRSGRASVLKTLIKTFLIPISELVLGVVLLFVGGFVMAFIENPLATILCLVLLAMPFSYGASYIIIVVIDS